MEAKAGDKISARARKKLATMMRAPLESIPTKVEPKSEGDAGQWLDIDDGYVAMHNMDMHGHSEEHPKHRWAWRSFTSGKIEAP